ncbi:MAG: hypothetical protein DKINENOH_04374 [bacterium]|nr:hypothetical protein [bacterium]
MKRYRLVAVMLSGVILFLPGCSPKAEEHADAAAHQHNQIRVKTIAGEASGFDCAVVQVLCPSTHRAADFTTGIFTPQKEFYFIVNIPQSFMTQYFLESMSVTGKVYPPYEWAIEPEQIHVVKDGEQRLVYESGYFCDPQGHKSMFNQGRVVEGRWVGEQCAAG